MKIKKYIAKNASTAKARIKEELGSDVVILSMRDIIIPPNNEKSVEIVVAIDGSATSGMSKEEIGRSALASAERAKMQKKPLSGGQNSPQEVARRAKQAYMQKLPPAQAATMAPSLDLMEVKQLLWQIKDEMKYKYSGSLSDELSKLYRVLINQGVSEKRTLNTVGKIANHQLSTNYDIAERQSRHLLTEEILLGGQLDKSEQLQTVFFTGATGCGKTSVLVKIAVILKLVHRADVLIVSADTYKVGSVEQLQTFASIAGLPFKSAYSPEELAEIISCENTRDFILVDTTGRSPFHLEQIDLIREYVQAVERSSVFYVQSCTASSQNFMDAARSYSILNPEAMILTKADEVRSLGAIIDTLHDVHIPLAYVTTGQQIPDNIEPANKGLLLKLILP